MVIAVDGQGCMDKEIKGEAIFDTNTSANIKGSFIIGSAGKGQESEGEEKKLTVN